MQRSTEETNLVLSCPELPFTTGKGEMSRISKVAARAQKELDIARAETRQLNEAVPRTPWLG